MAQTASASTTTEGRVRLPHRGLEEAPMGRKLIGHEGSQPGDGSLDIEEKMGQVAQCSTRRVVPAEEAQHDQGVSAPPR